MNQSLVALLTPTVIVGGAGKMGVFFSRILTTAGVSVEVVEFDTPPADRARRLAQAKCLIVSVPISATEAVIAQIVPEIAPDALLADITSVKEAPLRSMSTHPGEVLGLHPMCGPMQEGINGQPVVVCPCREGERARALCDLLAAQGAVLRRMDAAQHDRLMAVVQGMNHFHSIVFAHALKALGITAEETIEVASTVYRVRMQLMGRILAQDPKLYADIHLHNPHVVPALQAFMDSAQKFFSAIEGGSQALCVEFFKEAAAAIGSYGAVALRESDHLLAELARDAQKR